MNVDELVAYVVEAVDSCGRCTFLANPKFECAFIMEGQFSDQRDAVIARLASDYTCTVREEFMTCPVTGTFPVLHVVKK